jgi:uncharacterized membrane protein YedE/YeeE
MSELPPFVIRTLLGLLLGLALGFVARRGRFCTLGAFEDALYGDDTRRLRMWLLAVAVAIAGTQALVLVSELDLSKSIYVAPRLEWGGMIIGGLLFGLGMALVGTCGMGTLLRLGGGDLRSLMVFLIIAVTAMATVRGFLGLVRIQIVEPLTVTLPGVTSQRLPNLLGLSGSAAATLAFGIAALIAAMAFFVKGAAFVRAYRHIFTGVAVGALVVAGWWATGVAGFDEFDARRVESFTFVAPLGDTVLYTMLTTALQPDFPVGAVVGVILGAFVAARSGGQFRWEVPDDRREVGRHILGAVLMGFGGVTALGCTVGQGLTGVSTLAVGSFLAIASIAVGARIGLYWLVERVGTGQRSCA